MDDYRLLAERLGTVPSFQSLPPADLLTIVSAGRVLHFEAGETIFQEGDPCAGMYVLMRGQVNLCKTSPQGQDSILATIRPVIMFNEVALLDGGPNPVRAEAVLDCALWRIEHNAFYALLPRFPQLGLGLLRILAARNRRMIAHYEDLSFRSVMARTAKLLLELSGNGERSLARREYPIHELAARIATVPEVLSRSLGDFKRRGWIHLTRREIILNDVQKLAEMAQIDPFLLR